jgi:non-homologous end joining protein Ku
MTTNFIADAKEPTRSNGKITLSWGLLNIPLSTYTGTEETSVSRKEFVDGQVDHPAGRAIIDKLDGSIVDSSRVVRMAEASNGTFVEMTDEEMAACTGTRNVAEVLTFIKNEEILSYVPNKLMQVRPHRTKGVPDAAASKAFSLLVTAMTDLQVSALVKVAMRGPAQYAILTSTGDFIFVHSTDGVRKPIAMGLVPVTKEESEAAAKLIDSIGVMQAPRIPDVTAQAIGQYVDSKAAGNPAPKAQEPVPVEAVDLMSKLLASIDEQKSARKWGAPTGSPVAV